MLHHLRKQGRSFTRGMLYMLLTALVSLAIQPCVMASVQFMHCEMCPEQPASSEQASAEMPCEAMASCAAMDDQRALDTLAFARLSPDMQPALISWEPLYPVPLAPPPVTPESLTPHHPPPLTRFCVLQI